MSTRADLALHVLPGIPLIEAGDSLAGILYAALARLPVPLADGDVLVLAQKIVSKAEGRLVRLSDVTPSARAEALGAETAKDPRLVQLILDESIEVMRKRPGMLLVRHRAIMDWIILEKTKGGIRSGMYPDWRNIGGRTSF